MVTVTPLNTMLDRVVTLSRAMDQALANGNGQVSSWAPAIDAVETDQAYLVSIDLPGLTAENVDINFEKNTLSVRGMREQTSTNKEGARVFFAERDWGAFQRSLRFPQHVEGDRITAAFTNGVLTITVPKSEGAKARKIAITG
jgi:HSP20 family protein